MQVYRPESSEETKYRNCKFWRYCPAPGLLDNSGRFFLPLEESPGGTIVPLNSISMLTVTVGSLCMYNESIEHWRSRLRPA